MESTRDSDRSVSQKKHNEHDRWDQTFVRNMHSQLHRVFVVVHAIWKWTEMTKGEKKWAGILSIKRRTRIRRTTSTTATARRKSISKTGKININNIFARNLKFGAAAAAAVIIIVIVDGFQHFFRFSIRFYCCFSSVFLKKFSIFGLEMVFMHVHSLWGWIEEPNVNSYIYADDLLVLKHSDA